MSELDKLEKYLKDNGYKHRRVDEDGPMLDNGYVFHKFDRHQIVVEDENDEYLWDAICHYGSYGYEEGLLEVMGEALIGHWDVEGWLTAEQVVEMIERRTRWVTQ